MNLSTLNRCLLPFKQPLDQLGMKGTNRLCTRALNYQELIIRSAVPGGGCTPPVTAGSLLSSEGGGWAAAERRGGACVHVCVCVCTCRRGQWECCVHVLLCVCIVCTQCGMYTVRMHAGCVFQVGVQILCLVNGVCMSPTLWAECVYVPCVVCVIWAGIQYSVYTA